MTVSALCRTGLQTRPDAKLISEYIMTGLESRPAFISLPHSDITAETAHAVATLHDPGLHHGDESLAIL